MIRRKFLGSFAAAAAGLRGAPGGLGSGCGCALAPQAGMAPGADVFKDVASNLKITDIRSSASRWTKRSRAPTVPTCS